MDHRALCCLPDQLIPRRLDHLRSFLNYLPLRGRRQRDTQLALQLLHPVERSSGTVLELGDHCRRCFIVLFRSHSFRLLCREHLPTGTAAQPLE